MKLEDAVELLSYFSNKKETWADVGCGTGTFTLALANQLNEGSVIYAVDKNKDSLNKIPNNFSNVEIIKILTDFNEIILPSPKGWIPPKLNGIIMANSLHYVNDKSSFIKKISAYLKPEASILIVEYDTDKSNHWVPFPIPFQSLKILFENCGFTSVKKLKEHPSIYRRANMYSAIIKKQAN